MAQLRNVARTLRRNWIAVATFAVIVVGWEVIAHAVPKSQIRDAPLVPPWEYVFGDALLSLSDYWELDVLAPRPAYGGERTYLGAFLAIAFHSAQTLSRLLMGLVVGLVVGVGVGLLVSWSSVVRRFVWSPLNFVRMVPLLAAIPLFQFWYGATTLGTTIFIATGVGVLLVVATINAVANVPDRYVESARTLGASRLRTYLTVVIPAALPELRTTLLLAAGLSWSLEIGAEYIGLPDGLGAILVLAEAFANTGRMTVIAIIVIVCAVASFALLDRLAGRVLAWMPKLESTAVPLAAATLPTEPR